MKFKGLVPIEKSKVKKRAKYIEEVFEILSEFQKSNYEAVQINADFEDTRERNSLYNRLIYVRDKENIPIDIILRNGKIYLIKK